MTIKSVSTGTYVHLHNDLLQLFRELVATLLSDHGLDEEGISRRGAEPDQRREAGHQDDMGRGPEGGWTGGLASVTLDKIKGTSSFWVGNAITYAKWSF